MTLDRIAAWSVLAAVVLAVALVVAGAMRLAFEGRRLAQRAQAIHPPAIDLERANAAIERVQNDLAATTALLERAQAALAQIEANLRELADSPPFTFVQAVFRARARA
ncbi:MAG TPA: hypothetical protein VIN40_04460 [Candidatus Tyrphobacter sp.]